MALRTVDCRVPLHGSVEEALERLRRQVQALQPASGCAGGDPDYKVRERRFPTLAELDDIAPGNPIAVLHASWHSAMVNSQALKRMQIDGATPDPAGGAIARDPASGAPTGLLHEAAMGIVSFETMVEEFPSFPARSSWLRWPQARRNSPHWKSPPAAMPCANRRCWPSTTTPSARDS